MNEDQRRQKQLLPRWNCDGVEFRKQSDAKHCAEHYVRQEVDAPRGICPEAATRPLREIRRLVGAVDAGPLLAIRRRQTWRIRWSRSQAARMPTTARHIRRSRGQGKFNRHHRVQVTTVMTSRSTDVRCVQAVSGRLSGRGPGIRRFREPARRAQSEHQQGGDESPVHAWAGDATCEIGRKWASGL